MAIFSNGRGPGGIAVRALAVVFALIGITLIIGGVWLLSLGGSFYYVLAGLGLVASAVGLSSVDQRLGDVAAATLELLMGPGGQRVRPHGDVGDGPTHRLITPQLVVRRSSHLAPVEEDAGGTETGNRNGQ